VRTRIKAESLDFVTGAEPATSTAKFAYVTNHDDSTVSGYEFGAGDALSPLGSGPFATGQGPAGLVVHPGGRAAVVLNEVGATLSSFAVATNGSWSPFSSPVAAGTEPRGLALSPDGSHVYTADFGSAEILSQALTAATGELSEALHNPLPELSTPTALRVDPFGESLFVLDPGTSRVMTYTVYDGQTNGSFLDASGRIGPMTSSASIGNGSRSMTVGSTAEFLYVPNSSDNTVTTFRIGAYGALTGVPGSPFATDAGPVDVAVDPRGEFVYVANCAGNSISAYRSDGSTGALIALAGSPFGTGACPSALAMDPAGGFLLVTSANDNTLSRFNIDSATGVLSAAIPASVPAGEAPSAVVITAQPH
jgi:DNA-binding beta-propeller fold protein YncE